MSRPEKKLKSVLPWALMFFGVLAFAKGAVDVVDSLASYGWSEASATILESRVVKKRNSTSKSKKTSYHPYVQYTYTVGGEVYYADRISFGIKGSSFLSNNMSKADEVINKYPVAEKIIIYHDAKKPSESVIEKGFKLSALVLPVIGVALLLAGLAVFRQ